jgi:hypothetical protein
VRPAPEITTSQKHDPELVPCSHRVNLLSDPLTFARRFSRRFGKTASRDRSAQRVPAVAPSIRLREKRRWHPKGWWMPWLGQSIPDAERG